MSSDRILQEILLVHLGGSTKMVSVLRATPVLRLEVRWDLAGIYVLDLKHNELKDSRLRRGGQAIWKAADLEMCKRIYWNLMNPPKVERFEYRPTVKAAEVKSRSLPNVCDCVSQFCSKCEAMRKSV